MNKPMQFSITPPAGGEICDFCSEPNVYGVYQCENFTVDRIAGMELNSAGAWSACRECYNMIESDKWKELERRALLTFSKKYGIPQEVVQPIVKKLFMLFQKLRKRQA